MTRFVLPLVIATALLTAPQAAWARTRIEQICSVYGQKEIKLTGIGLVVGLAGTGDGGDSRPAMRALGSALQKMNAPITELRELKDSKNVAIVMIEATVPKTGLRSGQKLDCFVSSVMGAKSLRGGRLLVTPLTSPESGKQMVMGLASGSIAIEGVDSLTTGRVPNGVVVERDVVSLFVDKQKGHLVTLLLDGAHSTFHSAREVARVINSEFSFESGTSQIARASGPGTIEIRVPPTYHESPVEFIAQVLEIGIDNPHTEARVVVNARTGTVIVTGEVEITPVIIAHRSLTVQIGRPADGADAGEVQTGRFVAVTDQDLKQAPSQLNQLVEALNQLRVPSNDIVEIIRELHRSGKLHAAYEER